MFVLCICLNRLQYGQVGEPAKKVIFYALNKNNMR